MAAKADLYCWGEIEKDTGGEFWKTAGIYIHSLVQLKVPRTNCEQIALPSSSRACEHVHLIYEISYCYKDRR